jgi:hypothetical protein
MLLQTFQGPGLSFCFEVTVFTGLNHSITYHFSMILSQGGKKKTNCKGGSGFKNKSICLFAKVKSCLGKSI